MLICALVPTTSSPTPLPPLTKYVSKVKIQNETILTECEV